MFNYLDRILLHEKSRESMQLQLKTTREVLENRISELYLKNERLQTENAELKRWYGHQFISVIFECQIDPILLSLSSRFLLSE